MAEIEKEEQPQNKTEILSIRLDPKTKDKLAYICDLEYRPVALQIRKIIEDFIKDYENSHELIAYDKEHLGDLNYPGNNFNDFIPF